MFWLTFIVGVLYIPGAPSNATVGRWTALAAIVAILLWKTRIRPGPAHVAWAALLAWFALGFAWAVSAWDHAAGLWQWTVMFFAFCVAAETEDFAPAWKGLAAAMTVSAVFSVLQAISLAPVWSIYSGGSVGLFLAKNMAAEIAALAFIGAVIVTVRDRRNAWTLPGPLLSCLLIYSRTAAAMFMVAVAASVYFALPREDKPFAVLAAALLAMMAAILAVVRPELFRYGFMRIDDRMEIWSLVAKNIIWPWGDGFGSFQIGAVSLEFAHSEILQMAFELGVGSVLIWGIVVYALSSGKSDERVALAAFLVPCAAWWPLHAPATAMVFALLAGFLCGARRRAWAAEPDGGARSLRGAEHGGLVFGAGSIRQAGLGGVDFPSGQKSAMVRRDVRERL